MLVAKSRFKIADEASSRVEAISGDPDVELSYARGARDCCVSLCNICITDYGEPKQEGSIIVSNYDAQTINAPNPLVRFAHRNRVRRSLTLALPRLGSGKL